MYIKELINKGCRRIEGEVYEINLASQKVLSNLGFKKEGIKRRAHYDGNKYIDVFIYGLLINEFN